ncbi:MAG: 2-oxo acid dehydrogenase subunit E2 [Candidatus Marsarchaeota archaeon]|nr:2-oxo acid dehydrogenase subunit E2 [Candidatus Marsarchaeota archaeon]
MKEIKFVDVGEGITEGHLIKWLVKDGDNVKEDQSVAQVETDKAVVNVPAPISGVIKEVAKGDSILHLGDVVAAIGTQDEIRNYKAGAQAAQQPKAPQTQQQKTQPQAAAQQKAAATKPKEIIATPSVRKLAHDLNVDLSVVIGTGPNGRILENDIRSGASKTAKQSAPQQKFSEVLEEKHGEDIERVPMSMVRKAIAKNMEESWKIPRASHMDFINATELWNIVKKEKPKMDQRSIHLTFLPFVIKALVEALKENPNFNASYDHETQEIIVKRYYNIGLAAESEDGLKVVVVKNADKMSIEKIAGKIQELHKKIQDKTITIDEMHDTTITITNIGSLGGGFLAVPMINPPDVAIVGVLSIRDWPFVEDGKVKIGKILPFVVTFDHRVVDGAEAVKLGNAFKGYLEDPDFLEML